MKRVISILLAMVMMFALAACGGKSEADTEDQPVVEAPVEESTDEEGLTPREQFQQQKEAMEALLEEPETEDVPVTPCSFTAGGFTLNLDSSFTADYEQGKELMSYWHSNKDDSYSFTMKIGITPVSNVGGYTSSQEAAEDIAAQKPEERTVESANGVYYIVKSGSGNSIAAYYVDDSGYYWVIDGMTSTSVNFEDYKAQLVEFCTTGSIG